MRRLIIGLISVLALTAPVGAEDLQSGDVPLPRPRPSAAHATEAAPPLPQLRPAAEKSGPADTGKQDGPVEKTAGPQIYQTACPAVFDGAVVATAQPPIDDGICKVRSPLSATGLLVAGRKVAFSSPAIVGCGMATQLAKWAERVDAYAEVMFKSPVTTLMVGTSYECRPVNHKQGAKISEHGFADAVDILGFKLKNGTVVSLPGDWAGTGAKAQAMHYAHDAACGLFTTVLGPDADAMHQDNMHVDLACHGKTCTYRLCE